MLKLRMYDFLPPKRTKRNWTLSYHSNTILKKKLCFEVDFYFLFLALILVNDFRFLYKYSWLSIIFSIYSSLFIRLFSFN